MVGFPSRRSPMRRRLVPLLLLVSVVFIIYNWQSITNQDSLSIFHITRDGERSPPGSSLWAGSIMGGRWDAAKMQESTEGANEASHKHIFKPGKVKPLGQIYTKMVVMPRKLDEDVAWLTETFPPGGDVSTAVYVVDDPTAPLHPPKNKGHEVMVYLSYIIDHYDKLADVNIFLHAHRMAWHNDELLDHDAVQMISRLSSERVQREGYMNLRCHWEPGCPDWMHPSFVEENVNKQEQTALAGSWTELFPNDPIPQTLAQPCCAQFALSRDRIRSLPKSQYIFYRDWLLQTELSDSISGRVWEYLWQYLFTGRNVYCPKEHICYCDGFGVCFGGEKQYDAWWTKMWDKRIYEDDLRIWKEKNEKADQAEISAQTDEKDEPKEQEPGKDKELKSKIAELDLWLKAELKNAKERGNNPKHRAEELEIDTGK